MEIRKYQLSDYGQVKEILEEAGMFDEEWDSEKNLSSMPQILVAEDKNNVVGVLYINNFGKEIGWMFRLAVKKSHRKHGIATHLITKAEEFLKENGAIEVGMYVGANDQNLRNFYKKRGFKSSKKPYIYMWKALGK